MTPFQVQQLFATALAQQRAGQLPAAQQRCLEILGQDPSHAQAHGLLGIIACQTGDYVRAVEQLSIAVSLGFDDPAVTYHLGEANRTLGRLPQAIAAYTRALEAVPDDVEVLNKLGITLRKNGQAEQAIACYRRVIEVEPNHGPAHNNLGNVLSSLNRIDEAIACYQAALTLDPGNALAHVNLGNALTALGRLNESIALYRRAVELNPSDAKAHSNLNYALIFSPDYSAPTIFEECRRWDQRHAAPFAASIVPHRNDRSPERRLRVGYVSPEFRNHVQSYFTIPLFASHDHERFEIFAYSSAAREDSISNRLRGDVDHWRPIAGLTDEQAAQAVRDDAIDILVDLAMHMADNRLLIFARKPAPVQICWLAYPGTTGLSAMDYRLTDPRLDPPGLDDAYYSEESIRLPDTFWIYDPLDTQPAVNPLPALTNGFITFASFNNFRKVSEGVLKLWARVVKAVDRSRLLILLPAGNHRLSVLAVLESEGLAADRVTFLDRRPRAQYLEYYHQADIILDTFPYNGETMTLDASWMGVPTVTRIGPTVVARAGLSLLTALGLTDLAASNDEEFLAIAVRLAEDRSRLVELRASLRERLRASPLMDAPRFARNMEAVYRDAWRRWCAR
jgi:predicted O-linked N-acetylglucosamine transferase (SPINDLY family)